MDTWELIDAERADFADLADSLTPEQWDAPSLCTAWKVRDVVAHVTQGASMGKGEAVAKVLRYGFRIDKLLTEEARRGGAAPSDELARNLRATVGRRTTPPGATPEHLLADVVVHQQDVRRAIGVPRMVPHDRLRVVLDDVTSWSNSMVPTKKRMKGLHMRATDLDWEMGDDRDPLVEGSGEAVLMAVTGRTVALADLSGDGVDTLRERITS